MVKKEKNRPSQIESKPFLWKWQYITPVVAIFSGAIMFYVGQCNERNRTQRQLEATVRPSCALTFHLAQRFKNEPSYFLLKNKGPADLDDFWLEETIFLIDDSVHECTELPHFEYAWYRGSSRSLGTLKKDSTLWINLIPCWYEAFAQFSSQFSGKLISHFTLTGTSISAPRFREDFFFAIDVKNSDYINIDDHAGGKDLEEKVKKYLHHGPKSNIRHVYFSPKQIEYYKNPAMWWYQSPDGLFHSWHDTTMPRVSRIAAQIRFFSKYNIGLPSDSGTVKFQWGCDQKDFGPFWQTYSSAGRPSVAARPSVIIEAVLSKRKTR